MCRLSLPFTNEIPVSGLQLRVFFGTFRDLSLCIISERAGEPHDTVLFSCQLLTGGRELGVLDLSIGKELSDHLDQIRRVKCPSVRRRSGKREKEGIGRFGQIQIQVQFLQIHLLSRSG